MNQPTEDRIKKIEEKQEDIDRRLTEVERRTEPMPAVNVNVASQDVIDRLDALKQEMTQELHTVSNTWLNTLQEHYDEHKQAISDIQTVQRGHSKYFEEHGKRLAAMATKDELRSELSTMATKEDLATMKNEILDAMKQLLQQRGE